MPPRIYYSYLHDFLPFPPVFLTANPSDFFLFPPRISYCSPRISYCSADSTFDHVFAFIATNRDNSMECHAFLSKKSKMAQAATLTIAQV